MAHIIFAKFGTFVMTNDIDIYPHWYQFKYRDMRQTKWAFELKRLGKFLHLLFLKPINFKILELSIKYIKKVWYKFRNRTTRNTTFIVAIKADSRKKTNEAFVFILPCWEEECIFCKNFVWTCTVKFDTNERDWIKTLKLVLDKTI